VIFDFDYTLAELSRPADELMEEGAKAAEAFMRSRGMTLPPDFRTSIIEARRFSEEKSEEEMEEHLADDAMSFLLQFYGYPASKLDPTVLRQTVDVFYAPEMTAWRLYPGAREMLAELQADGYKLALVANHACDRVFQRTIDYLGLRPFFGITLATSSVEYRKPDTAVFNLILEQWDALPYEVVVVGDSLRHDIAAGIELGALTVQVLFGGSAQIDYNNKQLANEIVPDAALADLRRVPALIREWTEP
jgi:putative hydrolase of the HAD superfamily